jgi:hypothetical protein
MRGWYDVVNVDVISGWRERRLHSRDCIEGIDATRLVTFFASNNAPDPIRDANFEYP